MSHTSDLTNRRGQWRSRLGRPLIASAAALALVAVAGCGDEEPTSQASTPAPTTPVSKVTPAGAKLKIPDNAKKPGKRTLAWANDVCEAWGRGGAEVPAPDVSSKAEVKRYLEDVSELFGDKQAALEKIGPPPVGGKEGEKTYESLVSTLSTIERGIGSVAENPPSGEKTLNTQVAVIQRTRGPIPALRTDRALVLAFEQDSCKDVAR